MDFHIAPELQTLERFTFHEGTIEETLPKLESEIVDVVMLISVLEHLAEPQFAIQSAWRLLRAVRAAADQCSDMARKAIFGVICFPARPQSESRDGRSQNVLRQTRSLADPGPIWFQAESDSTKVSQIRSESVCGCQEVESATGRQPTTANEHELTRIPLSLATPSAIRSICVHSGCLIVDILWTTGLNFSSLGIPG